MLVESRPGAHVYVAAEAAACGGAITTFARNATTGALSALGAVRCRDALPDNYESAPFTHPNGLIVSDDGLSVYVSSFTEPTTPQIAAVDGIAAYRRDPAGGLLAFENAILGGKRAPYVTKGRGCAACGVSPREGVRMRKRWRARERVAETRRAPVSFRISMICSSLNLLLRT